MILIVDELFNFDDDRLRFIALDEGASISVPVELADIHTTEVGRDRQNPAPFGEKVVTEDWEITINELVRGNDAWVMTHEANQFNDPPDDGMEYIAIKVHVRFIGTEDRSANIDDIAFNTTGSANVLYALPSVVEPDPALDVNLFPGGEYAGWVITQAAQGETDLIAVFEPLFDFSGANKRFLSLEP